MTKRGCSENAWFSQLKGVFTAQNGNLWMLTLLRFLSAPRVPRKYGVRNSGGSTEETRCACRERRLPTCPPTAEGEGRGIARLPGMLDLEPRAWLRR